MHDNTRHTTRFTVIGNHLDQHAELSVLAIGLAVHIQSLPAGARVDIRTLADRFPEGATRIAAAPRELEAHGYLRRIRERTPAGRVVTRTVSCSQPATHRRRPTSPGHAARRQAPLRARTPRPQTPTSVTPAPRPPHSTEESHRAARQDQPALRRSRPLPAVPKPGHPSPALLRTAAGLLAGLHHHDARLLLSACDTAHLSPGVATWLERDVTPDAARHALTTGLPPEGVRRPAALLAHRLTTRHPPPPPFHVPHTRPPVPHPLQNCDGRDRAFRAPEPGPCRDCLGHAGP